VIEQSPQERRPPSDASFSRSVMRVSSGKEPARIVHIHVSPRRVFAVISLMQILLVIRLTPGNVAPDRAGPTVAKPSQMPRP